MPTQTNNHQKQLFIVVIIMAALWILNAALVKPLLSAWKSRKDHIAQTQTDIDNGRQLLTRKAVIESQWNKMRTNSFPSPQSQAEKTMLEAFDRWSQASQTSFPTLKPTYKQVDDDYATLIYRADISGGMDVISRFIYEVEKDPLALKVESVDITAHDPGGEQLSLSLQVSGLLLTPATKQP